MRNELIDHRLPFRARLAFVVHQGFERDAPVRTDAAELDLLFIEKLDQRWPRDIQHVGRFLRR